MITIDAIDENTIKPEKPQVKTLAMPMKADVWQYDQTTLAVQQHQEGLLQAANTARLLNAARGPGTAIEIQRNTHHKTGGMLALVERYLGWWSK